MYPYEQQKVQIYDINTLFEEPISKEILIQYHEKYCNITAKDLDKWRTIGRTIYQITNHTERQTRVQMRNIIEFYTLLNENHLLYEDGKNRWREVYLADDKVFDFFMNSFFYDCAKYLIDEKIFHYEETTELSNKILLQSVYLFITTFDKTTVSVIEMLAYIFDHKKQYFQINNKISSTFHIQQLFGLREDIREWLQNLQVGQIVDAIKIDKQYVKHCWSRAEIVNIQDDHIFIRFLNSSKQFNRSVFRENFDIREKGSKCPDEEMEWRLQLKEGDLVDCCDTSHVFYNSTVLQVKEIEDEQGYTIKQVYVGYRVYDPNGQRKDDKGKFNGWSQQYDEWFDATHPRIQKYQSQAKKLYTKASTTNQDEHIDDFNDLVQVLEVENEVVYASPKKNQAVNLFQLAAINKFGKKGGFELILNKIEGQGEEWCSIDHLASLMHMFANVQMCLNRNFVYPYAKRIIPAVQKSILDSPPSNLRNFTKEKIDSVNMGLGSFMKRIYSIGQKIEMLEKFNLQTALQSFNSEFITTQLQGLKTIMELLSQLRSDRTAESLQSSELKDWIEENQIFQKLFNSQKYQLIQKAGDFFKFMLNEGMIKDQHLEILWNQTRRNDTELKLAIYKILSDNFYIQSFDKNIIDFFLKKIIDTEPDQIGIEDIDLVHSFTRFRSNKTSDFQDSVRLFYWKLIENSYELPLDLVEETIKSFCESFNIDNNKITIQTVLEKCIDHINKGTHSTLYVLKVIQKIVDQLYTTQGYMDAIIKKEAVNFLFTDKNIVHVLVNNIRQMKKDLLVKIQENLGADSVKQLTEQILDSFIPRNTYIEHIQSRIDFLNFIYMNLPNDIELTLEVISEVWDAVIVEGLIPREKDIIYKWFSELNTNNMNNMNQSSQQIKKEDLDIFFHTKLCNEEDLRLMTPEGLNCFKSIFCILNEKDGKMKKFPIVKMYNNNNILYNNHHYNSQSYYQQNDARTNPDFEYQMLDLPTNLKGIQSLWTLITLNQNQEVIAKALEFLNNLHTNFDQNVSESEENIKRRYYQQAYEYLQKQTQEGDSEKIKRCIMIMESILDESEKKGNGGLKSLMSLSKGELITLCFQTTYYNSDIPNNFSFKMYTNDSVMDLLYKVGLYIKCTYEEVALAVAEPRREIEAKENGKSIAELRLKNGEKLLVSQRKGSPVKEEELLINGEINPKAIRIFKKWFQQFQVDGRMKPLQVAQFINSCTNDNCQENDNRVVLCMENNDKGKKGYLTEENFIEFYSTACRNKQEIVRKNLATHGYRKDLKRYDEVTIESIDVTSMPRYILARDEKFFKMVFDLLDRKDVANATWRFISRLPISPVLYEKIVKLEGIRNEKNPNWETVLGGESMYKLLYNLHVIEYLMEEGEVVSIENKKVSSTSYNKIISDESEELKQFKMNWRSDFIKLGGFDHLFKRFNQLITKKDILNIDTFQKYILSFILKIFKNYIVAAFACDQSQIYKTVTRMSLTHVPLPALILSIREDIRNNRELTVRRKESEYRENLIEQELKRMETMDDQQHAKNQNEKKQNYEVKIEESEEFLQLLSSLQSQGLSNQILQKFDFMSFLNQLCKLCMDFITSNSELESEDRIIVEYSLLIVSAILTYDKTISDQFFDQDKSEFTQLLSSGLFYKGNQNIRKIFNHCFFMIALSHLSNSNSQPIQRLMHVLINNIPGLHNDNQNCTQYFELFCGLLDSLAYHQIDTSVSYDWLDFSSLLKQLVSSLKNHESTETRTHTRNDKILIGILNLCDRILSFKEELKVEVGSPEGSNLVKEIFHKCLFDLQDHHLIENEDIKKYDKLVVKCKGETSRIAAFRLLLTLCKNCPENMQVLMENGLQQLIEMLPQNTGYQLSYMRESKSDYGYVGIKNLGCICYMIAMIQQFFMTPTFRYAILMANDEEQENLVEAIYNKKKMITDDNILHQFQQMFSFLEMSDRVDYNPIEFCYSFKDYSGEPVNTVIQQDAQEFLNMIFDKLENGLKKTPFKNILENVYGGKQCSQVICSNCKQVSTTYQQFYNLSVEVKNFKSLTESLDKFIAGETIQDFRCEGCDKKVEVTIRNSLANLPNVLIVHLKRIIFDLESLQNIKVNTRLEFPENLDLEPYTKEGLEAREQGNKQNLKEKQNYEYKLAGVVVHTGTAEYGHYYSYIDFLRQKEHISQQMKESWLEFNDSRVRDFSIKNIENECFGGHNTDWDDSSFNFGWFRNRDNSKNAYILVYEKKVKDPVQLVFENTQQMEKVLQYVPISKYEIQKQEQQQNEQKESEQVKVLVDYFDFQPYVPDNFFKKVWMDNHQFMFERHIYNDSFYQFIKEITNSIDLPVLTDEDCPKGYYKDYDKYPQNMRQSFTKLLQTHAKIIMDLLSKSHGSQMIDEMINRLRILLKLCPDYCAQFFLNNFMKDFANKEGAIIKSQDPSVKNFLSKMYADCTQIIINFHDLKLTQSNDDLQEEKEQVEYEQMSEQQRKNQTLRMIKNSINYFLNTLLQYLQDFGQKNVFKNEQYFMFWEAFSQQGPEQMKYLIQADVCLLFLDYFMGDDSPLSKTKEYMSSRSITLRYTHVTKCIANIIDHAYTPIFDFNSSRNLKREITTKLESKSQNKEDEYTLSEEISLFIFNSQFWEKLISNETIEPSVLKQLIQKLAFNQQLITNLVSEAIVRGLYRLGLDEVKIYAQAVYHFLSLQDNFRKMRIEAVLGVPILVQNYLSPQQHNNQEDSLQVIAHYGTYALNCIDDQSLCMKTSLQIESTYSILEAIYVNRKNSDSISVQLLIVLLQLVIENEDIAEYVALAPAPSYVFAKYVDFIDHFIKEYHHNSLIQKYAIVPRVELAQNCLMLYPYFRQKIDAVYQRNNIKFTSPEDEKSKEESASNEEVLIKDNQNSNNQEGGEEEKNISNKTSKDSNQYNIVVKEIDRTEVNYSNSQQAVNASQDSQNINFNNNHLNQGIYPLYTIGKTRDVTVLREAQLPITDNFLNEETMEEYNQKLEQVKTEQEFNKLVEELNELKEECTHSFEYFNLYEREVNTFITDSQPTQTGNKSYDSTIVRDYFIITQNMSSTSPWNGFFKNKYASYYNQSQLSQIDQQEQNNIIEKHFKNANTVREIVAVNKTSNQIDIKLNFILHDPENPNQKQLPKFGKYIKVKAKSNEVIFSVQKLNLQEDWGNYDIQVEYSTFQFNDRCQLHLQFIDFSIQKTKQNIHSIQQSLQLNDTNSFLNFFGVLNSKQLLPVQNIENAPEQYDQEEEEEQEQEQEVENHNNDEVQDRGPRDQYQKINSGQESENESNCEEI
ncbi:ubiquitin carboxy-terminal hydrolase (macronuclear) [Tetrahymena thermophila SB210]|uniref:ubiquitinyl hydrolase 1 n=1 Tax=Tetrahymena thermophila (strain SB210) TaxID=312017 RepID=Q23DI7_TETTS|nr:ubiquitin carboxy-terminal hydrolase [Tetrahymena thermophila SB210]EAR94410.2 ubiquitin carboxy-terminal hydrolase [Tetrahymena thermophila SB210]|eukprot:XP_001014699.2 ubiquitin carboxy-terminal hydrolase [Tetrahymena thermophila SB210]